MTAAPKFAFRPKPLDLDDVADPFAEFDQLERKEPIERLTHLLENVESPLVLGIDGPWGTGKTTFLQLWDWHLRQEDFETVFFNAWEHDYLEYPLLDILGQILAKKPREKEKRKRVLEASKKLIRRAMPLAVRLLSQGLVDWDKGGEALGELVENVARDRIEKVDESRSVTTEFREALIELVEQGESDKPLVFFIDELDRCRPTYAVELLERIKHFFEVPGIYFVLGVNTNQLANAVRAVYGSNFDGPGYLQRFFDLSWRLPEPETARYADWLVKRLFQRDQHDDSEGLRDLRESFVMLSALLKLSLRQQAKCIALGSLILKTIKRKERIYPGTLAFLCVMNVWRANQFQEIVNGKEPPGTGLREMEVTAGKKWRGETGGNENYKSAHLEAEVMYCKALASKYSNQQPEERVTEHLDQAESDNESIGWEKRFLGSYNKFKQRPHLYHPGSWKVTVDRVSFAHQFLVSHQENDGPQ